MLKILMFSMTGKQQKQDSKMSVEKKSKEDNRDLREISKLCSDMCRERRRGEGLHVHTGVRVVKLRRCCSSAGGCLFSSSTPAKDSLCGVICNDRSSGPHCEPLGVNIRHAAPFQHTFTHIYCTQKALRSKSVRVCHCS